MQVYKTDIFKAWLLRLRDHTARARIIKRIDRLASGNFGQWRSLGHVSELKIDHGPGYRVYFATRASRAVILLCGGDKSSQASDIERAKQLAAELDWKEIE